MGASFGGGQGLEGAVAAYVQRWMKNLCLNLFLQSGLLGRSKHRHHFKKDVLLKSMDIIVGDVSRKRRQIFTSRHDENIAEDLNPMDIPKTVHNNICNSVLNIFVQTEMVLKI
jgi:hypothetical protein